MKIKKITKRRFLIAKSLRRFKKHFNRIGLDSNKRVEANSYYPQQNISTYPISKHRSSTNPEDKLSPAVILKGSDNQTRLPWHLERSKVDISSFSVFLLKSEEERRNRYKRSISQVLPLELKNSSSILSDLIQSTKLLRLNSVENPTNQEFHRQLSSSTILSYHDSDQSSWKDESFGFTPKPNIQVDTEDSASLRKAYLPYQKTLSITEEIDEISVIRSSSVAEKNIFENDEFSIPGEIDIVEETDDRGWEKCFSFLSYEQIIPDDNNPQFYCRVCNITSVDRAEFYRHLTKKHQMILRPFFEWRANEIVEPHKDDPDNYCSICDKSFTTAEDYLNHFSDTIFHKFDDRKEINPYRSVIHQCKKCDRQLKGVISLQRHYFKIHNVTLDFKEHVNQHSMIDHAEALISEDFYNTLSQNVSLLPNNNVGNSLQNDLKSINLIGEAEETSFQEDSQPTKLVNEAFKNVSQKDYKLRKTVRRNQQIESPNNTKRILRSSMTPVIEPLNQPIPKDLSPTRMNSKRRKRLPTGRILQKPWIKRKTKYLTRKRNVTSHNVNPNNTCRICNKVFATANYIPVHMKVIHRVRDGGNWRKHSRKYKAKDNIENNIASIKILGKTKFNCTYCDKQFKLFGFFKNHIKRSHITETDIKCKNEYRCDVCCASFILQKNYDRHFATKAHLKNVEEAKLYGNLVSVVPTSVKSLDNNIKIKDSVISTESAYNIDRCDSCDITFHNKSTSLMHFFKIHKFNYVDTQESVESSQTYERKPNINMLLKNDPLPKEDDPNLFCNVCRRKFSNKGNFRLHLVSVHKMNLSEKRFEAFASDTSNEEVINPNDPNHYCAACNKSYSTTRWFHTHLQKIHKLVKKKNKYIMSK